MSASRKATGSKARSLSSFMTLSASLLIPSTGNSRCAPVALPWTPKVSPRPCRSRSWQARASWTGSGEAARRSANLVRRAGRSRPHRNSWATTPRKPRRRGAGHLQGWRPGDGGLQRWRCRGNRHQPGRLSMALVRRTGRRHRAIASAKAKGQVYRHLQKWLGALHVHSVRVTEGT